MVQLGTAAGASKLAVGVNNVFDRQPPVSCSGRAASAASSDPGAQDYMGRFGYARLTQQF